MSDIKDEITGLVNDLLDKGKNQAVDKAKDTPLIAGESFDSLKGKLEDEVHKLENKALDGMLGLLGLGKKAYSAGRYTFEFDDKKPVGFVASLDGGNFKSDPLTIAVGTELVNTRLPGKLKYDDITVQIGAAMAPAFYKWMQATLDLKPERKSGALVGYDFNSRERSRRSFYDALIAEIGFPALDGSSKQQAYFTVKIAPERLDYKKGDGLPLLPKWAKDEERKQKQWLCSNFMFELERFKGDKAIRNAKVDAFTVKQNVIVSPVGTRLEPAREIGKIEMPTLSVTFSETQMELWMQWWKESVAYSNRSAEADNSWRGKVAGARDSAAGAVQGAVGGKKGASPPPPVTTGSITYLGANKHTELMRLDLDGVRLHSLEITRFEPGKEAMATGKATLTVDRIKIVPGKGNS